MAKALKERDISAYLTKRVTEIGGIKTENVSDARAIFDKYSAGDSISVELNRDGQTRHESMILKTKRDMLTAERD